MSTTAAQPPILDRRLHLGFDLDDSHTAHEPPESRGIARDQVRLMVSRGMDPPEHRHFADLPNVLSAGDLLVVNTSATVPAAIDAELHDGTNVVIHLSTELPGGLWIVEPRRPEPGGATSPWRLDATPHDVRLADGTLLHLLRPSPGSQRLWLATVDEGVDLIRTFTTSGRPIRYHYVTEDWPIDSYQTVFATEPGSAEMPSAARPFTPHLVARLIGHGISFASLTLHTGVSSLESHELPYPERYSVPATTASMVNGVHRSGGRVIAVGTTVVRALESAVDDADIVHPAEGWTDLVVSPARGVRAVDGLITGWHEPAATHLAMLEAVAGPEPLAIAYDAAWHDGYLWHEFGDTHLLLKGGKETFRPVDPPTASSVKPTGVVDTASPDRHAASRLGPQA